MPGIGSVVVESGDLMRVGSRSCSKAVRNGLVECRRGALCGDGTAGDGGRAGEPVLGLRNGLLELRLGLILSVNPGPGFWSAEIGTSINIRAWVLGGW
jgi:hypothetical protein